MSIYQYNVNQYTTDELFSILSLDPDTATEQDVMTATNAYIQDTSDMSSPELRTFFQDVQTKLMQEYATQGSDNLDNQYAPDTSQVDTWTNNQYIPQPDPTQASKITDRSEQIDVFNNDRAPMNRNFLGVSTTYPVTVAQSVLNPNLRNITERTVNLDSLFRPLSTDANDTNTSYSLELSDVLTNVLSMRLYSIQIPYTWYVIDTHLGNTCLWINMPEISAVVPITLPPGNYTIQSFITQFESSVSAAGFFYPDGTPPAPLIQIPSTTAKVSIQLNGWAWNGYIIRGIQSTDVFIPETDVHFMFFDPTGTHICVDTCGSQSQPRSIESSLGWLMGFRTLVEPVYVSPGTTAPSIIDLIGTKYFILVIDDFVHNRVNNGLVSINPADNALSLPDYYSADQPYTCQRVDEPYQVPAEYPVVLPSAPRTLTQAQIYSINEIVKSRVHTTTYRAKAPTVQNMLSLIPVRINSGIQTGSMYTENGDTFQNNRRIYFGPVRIHRLRVRLVDDRGRTVNLNGVDWCATLITEHLYQY